MTTAARFVREARRGAGWTQRQLADRSGVAVSVISAYENGRRDPGVETLAHILRAMGQGLQVVPRSEQSRHVELVMQLVDVLPQQHDAEMGFPPFRTLLST